MTPLRMAFFCAALVPVLSFQLADTNNDGKLTRQELGESGVADSVFARIDKNQDGIVTQAELNFFGPLTRTRS